ncbi:NAD-dependent epimerase/dehydratase family protein [Flavobacterium sp. RSP29]|uniref:NAD-dependent epimerase/dehydratase family protein n=1 Tax=Flavobacterium sp. RSP29 TaxID=3401731 RepID=UPI003AACC38E
MQKTILLTGATGFLGSHLLEALLLKGNKVVILKRSTSNIWRIKHLIGEVISYDVDNEPLELAFTQQRIDCVMHTACHYGRNGDSISQTVETNLIFSLRILDACLKFNTDTFFNTDTLLSKHLNVYTLSKKQFVEWLQQNSDKIQVVNLKLEHMYGPKDDITKFIPWVISQLKTNVPEIKLTKGEQFRDFIYVDDVVSAYLTTLEKVNTLNSFSQFDVGTGKLISVKDFLRKLKYNFHTDFGKTSAKLLFGAIPYRSGEMMTVEVNNTALLDLGWKPKTSNDNGIQKLLNSYK